MTGATKAAAHAAPKGGAELFSLIEPHLHALDQLLREQVREFEPEIRDAVSYCLEASGKRIRPALVFFSGWQGDAIVSPPLVRLAAVIEMVHLATLVHDDIMDGADVRRQRPTAARKFGADTAVLLGDALFAQALNIASQFPTTEVCAAVSGSTRKVCAGEIMQTLAAAEARPDRLRYQRIIDLKTAELFFLSCFLGARLGGAEQTVAQAAGDFGRHLGTAYQIYDDLADFFGDERNIGKTLGTDWTSGKATLPLLLLLERLSDHEAAELRRAMKTAERRDLQRLAAQMARHGVFAEVMESIRREIGAGTNALQPWNGAPPADLLRRLAETLAAQAAALQANLP